MEDTSISSVLLLEVCFLLLLASCFLLGTSFFLLGASSLLRDASSFLLDASPVLLDTVFFSRIPRTLQPLDLRDQVFLISFVEIDWSRVDFPPLPLPLLDRFSS